VTIVEFLEARLEEDEDTAQDAAGWDQSGTVRDPGVWCREGVNSVIDSSRRLVVFGDGSAPGDSQAAHIVRHDPARVLCEVAAKRALLVSHDIGHDPCDAHDARYESVPCDVILNLAAIYSGHPDYREEWVL
jgi:hypothetical protein